MPPSLLDLIADPVRLAIVRQLAAAGRAPLAEIADRADVHVNTVRSHMTELEAAGLVEREHATPEGPGRPQVCYRLSAEWQLPSTDMRGLTELLASLAIRLEPTVEDIQELGRQWGRYLSGRPGDDPLEALPRLLERLGFDAEVHGCEVRLSSCPCPLVSPDHPELICRLAGATIEGIAAASPRRWRVSSTEHDPDRRRCTIHLAERPRRRGASALPTKRRGPRAAE
jgi:predicted ArsR family transcriptional regulator